MFFFPFFPFLSFLFLFFPFCPFLLFYTRGVGGDHLSRIVGAPSPNPCCAIFALASADKSPPRPFCCLVGVSSIDSAFYAGTSCSGGFCSLCGIVSRAFPPE